MSTNLADHAQSRPAPLAAPEMPNAEPCVVVIFGASGDLARRKLIPALYNLACEDCGSKSFQVLGVGRTPVSDDEFRRQMREAMTGAKEIREFTEDEWARFAPRLSYMVGDPNDDGTHEELAERLEQMREAGASANRLYYLSTPPSAAPGIIEGLGRARLNDEAAGWSRIVVEKPFGVDLKSARALNQILARHFREDQVYRIDHFLGKDTVQNIMVFRFGNSMFEPIWNRNYIDYVEITGAETLGVGSRAGFYEEAGALRDMIANHLLQILTLTAMEPPAAFDADSIREEKVQVLRSIHPMTAEEVARRTVRAQYGAHEGKGDGSEENTRGYRQETGVAPDSETETYAAVEFHIENWRWAGVPFYVRTGKRLTSKLTEVAVHLKRTPQALFARARGRAACDPNVIVLRLQPHEGIEISFEAKRPGVEMFTNTARLAFSYEHGFGVRPPAAYETLLLDAMQGDPTLFTRGDETEAQWRLITPILETWHGRHEPALTFYEPGTGGPAAANELLARRGHTWRPLASENVGD